MNLKNYCKIITLALLLFLVMGCVTGGGGETNTSYTQYDVATYQDIIYAEEDGHFDIQFSDDYKGYCLEYGEEEATKGDMFYMEQTNYTLNSDGEDVSNELKTYFVEYYNETQKDKVVTQHTIWHFTDGFDGWRVNKTLVNDIKSLAEKNKINDDGKKQWNSTHEMIYSFRSLVSPIEEHQNFFAYKIIFQLINVTEENNTITDNTTSINNTTNILDNITNNNTNLTEKVNDTVSIDNYRIDEILSDVQYQKNSKIIYLNNYDTGVDLTVPIIALMLIGILISYKLKKF